jgi:hypothetical protein
MLTTFRMSGLASLLLIRAFAPDLVLAGDPSGSAVKVVPAASAAGQSGSRVLKAQGPVFMGDQLATDRIGEAQILFRDETRLVVGPNSRMVIDRFVYSPDQTAQAVGMKALKGTFRFITGVSRKQAYSIKTPTMSIGVRGTRFDFTVRSRAVTIFALYEGGARLCDARGHCVDVEGTCKVVTTKPAGGFADIDGQMKRTQTLAAYFPYAKSQRGLLPDFRVDSSGCQMAQAPLTAPGIQRAKNRDRAPGARPIDPDGSHGGGDSGGGGRGSGGGGGSGGSPDGS